MLKLSKTGITVLKRQYKSVLMKCLLINAGILLAANVSSAAAVNVTATVASGDTWAVGDTIGTVNVPTKTSDLTNDSGFITSADLPTNVSDLTNDAGYQTASQVSSAISSAISTVESGLNTANGKITALETSVATKANQSDLTTLSGTVSTIQGNISDLQTNKADKTTVNGLDGRITTLEGAGYQTSTQVSGAITSALANGGNAYQTSSQVSSAISSAVSGKADTSTVTAIDTRVTNLETAVGDSTSGLVKDVADLKSAGYQTSSDVSSAISSALANSGNAYQTASDVSGSISSALANSGNAYQTASDVSGSISSALANSGNAYQTASDVSSAIGAAKANTALTGNTTAQNIAVSNTLTVGGKAVLTEGASFNHDAIADWDTATSNFVTKETGKGLSTNDFTDAAATKLAGIAEGAQVNVIETIKVNGTALSVTGKAVDITVPTKTSDLSNDSGYVTLENVRDDATSTTAGSLGAIIKGTKVDAAGTADSAKAVTADAIDGSTIVLDGGKIKVGSITHSNVSDFDTQVAADITASINSTADNTIGKALSAKQDNLVINSGSGLAMASDGKTLSVSGVTSAMIENGTITGADIASQTITSANIANNTITATQIANNTISSDQIADNAITANELADNAVDTAAIAGNAVTLAKLNSDVYTTTAATGDAKLITSGGVFAITNVAAGGNYISAGTDVAGNLTALDSAIGAKIGSDGNFIKSSTTNSVNANIMALDGAIGDLSGFNSQNYAKNTSNVAANITALDSALKSTNDIVGTAETAAVSPTSLVTGKIGDEVTVVAALRTVADNAAGLHLSNTFDGANTFKNNAGITIQDTAGANSASLAAKAINLTEIDGSGPSLVNDVLTVDTAMLVSDVVASTNGFSVVKNTSGSNYTEVFSIDDDGHITSDVFATTATGMTVGDTTNYVKANADGTLETTGAATIGNGLTVSAGGAAITGDSTITGKLSVSDDFSVNGTKFTVEADDGSFSASSGKFTVDGDGAVSASDGNFTVSKEGNTVAAGTLSAAANKFTVDGDGAVSASDGNFTVSKEGNTVVAGTMDITGNTNVGSKFAITAADGSMSAAGGKLTVDANGAIRAAGGEFVVDKDGNTRIKGALGAGANGTEFGVGSDGSISAAKGKFTVDKDGATKAESLAFNNDTAGVLVNSIDQGANAITNGTVDTTAQQTMATNATVAKTVGNLKTIRYEDDGTTVKAASHGVTDVSDVASAISTLATNVETATGGTFTDATWNGKVKTDTLDYTYGGTVGYDNIMNAVSTVASNVGAAVSNTYNGVAADATVNANIDAVNAKIGDWANLHKTYTAGASTGNALTNGGDNEPATVVAALNNIDATLGTIHGLSAKLEGNGTYQGNLADGTTVEQHLTALDTAIGDRSRFNSMHYTQGSNSVVDAIDKLDAGLYDLDHEVRTLRHHFEAGMASAAALSALQPNARATGNTQLAIGTGAYKGHGAMAIGGFHWVTDNLLLNAGVAYDSNEPTYRMGITYSW